MSTESTKTEPTGDTPPEVLATIERLLDAGASAGEGGAGALAPERAGAVTVRARPDRHDPAPSSPADDEAPAQDAGEAPLAAPLPAAAPAEEALPSATHILAKSWPLVRGFGRQADARAHCTFIRGAASDEMV
jgi:hypothetical protein